MDAAILNSRLPEGNSVDIAHYKEIKATPFSFERRRSACIVAGVTGAKLLICKGAFEEVLGHCSSLHAGGQEVPLNAATRQALTQRANEISARGFRVLLIAMRRLTQADMDLEIDLEALEVGMTVEGLLSFTDPPKEDTKESVKQLKALGVGIKILTGDNPTMALNVCRTPGLVQNSDAAVTNNARAISGPELELLHSTNDFDAAVMRCSVIAKLSPYQKGQIVASLQKANHCVDMLGDRINDCIALRESDVGISVDSGSGVAKDCADLILTEKGLSVIVDGVKMGRITHGNTMKYIKMVASSNFGNVFSILAASAWLPFTPITSTQILVQNLLYNIGQIAIPWDHVDVEYLEQPKRWSTFDLFRFVIVFGPTSSAIDIITFSIGWFFYGIQNANNDEAVKRFQTHWFLQGLLTQTLIVHLLRTAKIPFFQSRASRPLAISTVTIMAIGFVLPWIPAFHSAISFMRPASSFVGFLGTELLLYCAEIQLVKMGYINIFKTWM